MTLEEFTAPMRESINQFEAGWKVQMTKKPNYFPAEMKQGDWYEQFLIFNQTESF